MTNELAIVDEQEQQIDQQARGWLADAERLVIDDAESAQVAADFLREDIAPRRKAVETFFAPLVTAAHAAHKALTTRRAAILKRFEEPERIVRQKLAAWHADDDRRQRAADEAVRLTRAEAGGTLVLPPIAPDRPEGVSFTTRRSAEVFDLAALCRAAADNPQWLALVQPNQAALDLQARSLGAALAIPGVRVVTSQMTRVA